MSTDIASFVQRAVRQNRALVHLQRGDRDNYYEEMEVIGSHAMLRRLWIEEGERRGYELVDA